MKLIDFHTHPVLVKGFVDKNEELLNAVKSVFNFNNSLQPIDTFICEMDTAGIDLAVLLPIDCTSTRNCKIFSNEQIFELCKMSKRFIGFGSVDPHNENAPNEIKNAVEKLNLKGLKLDPGIQEFSPDDRKIYPVYEAAISLKIPILFHMGLSWESNHNLKYSHPLLLDEVARNFKELKIVIAHFGWPWVLDSVALALKHENVYMDTSALYMENPKNFLSFILTKQISLNAVETCLREKILFGSNYPRIEMFKMANAMRSIGLSKKSLDMIFENNAKKILQI